MGRITELRLKDIRCFDGEQSARLSRITLLVGENSAGKSTFLGCYKTLATLANLQDLDDKNYFDDAPFHMGSFDTIVRSGKTAFTVGGRFENHCHTNAEFTFHKKSKKSKGLPFEHEVKLKFNARRNSEREIDISWTPDDDILRFKGPNFNFDLQGSEISFNSISAWLSRYVRHGHLPFHGELDSFRSRKESHRQDQDAAEFVKFINFFQSELPLPREPSFVVNALDPALPSRKRVFESLPSYLASYLASDSDLKVYQEEIGGNLGLWKNISVQPGSDGRGFEVRVETASGSWNLADVGYGVHSLLPLAQAMQQAMQQEEPATIFLLQQPEIHVHPAVQAQLAQSMVDSNLDFVIETHSEHFVDRFKICVMEGVLRPEELSIVYFETDPDKMKSRIHNIAVDGQANLIDAPDGYRKFFMEETKRFMGL